MLNLVQASHTDHGLSNRPNRSDVITCLKQYESYKSIEQLGLKFYDKESDLKRSAEVKCNILEMKFKISILDYLKNNFLDLIEKSEIKATNENDTYFIQCVNNLLNLIHDKQTVIIKR